MSFKVKVAALLFLALLLIYASALLPLAVGWLVNDCGTIGMIILPLVVLVWGVVWVWLAFTASNLLKKALK
jgi:hypothetical protein